MRFFFIVILLFTVIAGCRRESIDHMGENADPGMVELLLDSSVVTKVKLFAAPMVKTYYAGNGYRRIWTEDTRFIKPADTILNIIRTAKYYGLFPKDYHHDEIEYLLQLPIDDVSRSRIDILLTDAFFALRYHLKNGRLSKQTFNPVRHLTKIDSTAITELEKAVDRNSIRKHLDSQEPQHKAYRALKTVLRNLITQQLNDSNSIMKLSSKERSLHNERILKAFVNLERWRWEREEFPDRYLVVNVPSYRLYVIEDNEIVLQSDVIVGDIEHNTPVLSSTITNFVIYPYWHVPRSIATKEILPLVQQDPSYLEKNNFEVLDFEGNILDPGKVKWRKVDEEDFNYLFRQREGPENSLGIIKFVFSNPYNVYLHDTNARGLFKNQYRALSHGCIRVEKATELAEYLVCLGDECSPEKMYRSLRERKRKEIKVKKPIPVYIRYFTVDTFGDSATFHHDVYDKDENILQLTTLKREVL